MKKLLLIVSALLIAMGCLTASSQAAVGEDLTKATITSKVDLPALLSRKTYRLGVRAGIMSPGDDLTVTKDTPFSIGLDFDAKLNENLDTGPRFTYMNKKYTNAAGTINASYGMLMFGYGARMYVTYWGDYGSTHGFLNAYIAGEANYCVANRSEDLLAAGSPSSFSGFAANGGVGIELAFGPNSTGFVDIRYQKSSIKDSAGTLFPADGIMINFGTRLAFI